MDVLERQCRIGSIQELRQSRQIDMGSGMGGYGIFELGWVDVGYLQYQLTHWVDGCWNVSGDFRISIRLVGFLSKAKIHKSST